MRTIEDLKNLPHKGCDPKDWEKVHQGLRIIAYELLEFCESRNLPVVITSIIRPMIPGVSKTDIHAKSRAFDVSVKGWNADNILECVDYINDLLAEDLGAIAISDGKPRAVVYHVGTAPHLHCQTRPSN